MWSLVAAVFLGTFALPSKYVKNFAWENTWGAFFFIGMLIVPVGFACVVVKDLWATYDTVPWSIILSVMALGCLWGCGFCCWGFGISMLGLSLGYAVAMGTMALVGSIVPFFLGSADTAATPGGMTVIVGILICICGVAVNGYAGMQREKSQTGAAEGGGPAKPIMLKGLIICVCAGVLSSGLNIAFHVGGTKGGISKISAELGNPAWRADLSIWTLIFLGGLISSFGFSVIRLCRYKTWAGFAAPGAALNILLATLMAIGHFACIFFYGLGAGALGVLGTSVAFAIFQSGSLLVGNGLGFMTGEWKGASGESKRWLCIGLTILIAGIIVVSVGNWMTTQAAAAAAPG